VTDTQKEIAGEDDRERYRKSPWFPFVVLTQYEQMKPIYNNSVHNNTNVALWLSMLVL